MSDSATNKTVSILAAYWLRNPAACDTPEGMHRWWMNGRIDASIANVEAALDLMVERGLVERRVIGGRSIYRLCTGSDPGALESLA